MDNTHNTPEMLRTSQTPAQQPRQFHFWRIMIVCNLVVAFCAFSAWVVSTYFYE